jgi:hypothetical protein
MKVIMPLSGKRGDLPQALGELIGEIFRVLLKLGHLSRPAIGIELERLALILVILANQVGELTRSTNDLFTIATRFKLAVPSEWRKKEEA